MNPQIYRDQERHGGFRLDILVVSYNSETDLAPCLNGLVPQLLTEEAGDKIWLFDNASQDSSAAIVETQFPSVVLLRSASNIGFAPANNRLLEYAFKDGADACLLINPDTTCAEGCLEILRSSFLSLKDTHPDIGLLQPSIFLTDRPTLLNTQGNALHYLGFGYCQDFGRLPDARREPFEIVSPSGACVLVSRNYYEEVGAFDESFFMYCEDQDLAWRGLLQGFRHYCIPSATIFHRYVFSASPRKFFYLERNRIRMLLRNYAVVTLFALLPMLLLFELLIIGYALQQGWIREKLQGYRTAFASGSITRSQVQRNRKKTDAALLHSFEAKLQFSEITSPVIKLLNPVLVAYKYLLLKVVP